MTLNLEEDDLSYPPPKWERHQADPSYTPPTEIQMYAVREVGTGLYFPERQRGRIGYTFLDPEMIGPNQLPRLFSTISGAKVAIAAWRKGAWHKHRGVSHNYWGDEDYEEWFEIKPVEYRKDVELEIVPVTITFGRSGDQTEKRRHSQ